MGFLDLFALFILLIILIGVVGVVLWLGWLPGNFARSRHSPWAEPINVAGWIGILLPPIWMLALIAAFVRPPHGEGAAISLTDSQSAELAATISGISRRMADLEAGMSRLTPRAMGRGTGGLQP
jgi:hypothetical protein